MLLLGRRHKWEYDVRFLHCLIVVYVSQLMSYRRLTPSYNLGALGSDVRCCPKSSLSPIQVSEELVIRTFCLFVKLWIEDVKQIIGFYLLITEVIWSRLKSSWRCHILLSVLNVLMNYNLHRLAVMLLDCLWVDNMKWLCKHRAALAEYSRRDLLGCWCCPNKMLLQPQSFAFFFLSLKFSLTCF